MVHELIATIGGINLWTGIPNVLLQDYYTPQDDVPLDSLKQKLDSRSYDYKTAHDERIRSNIAEKWSVVSSL